MNRTARSAATRATARALVVSALACALAACADNGANPGADDAPSRSTATSATAAPAPVRAQDDMYRAVNGAWLASNDIPADRSAWGAVYQLRDDTITQLANVIKEAGEESKRSGDARANGQTNVQRSADQKKIADLYASFMDEPRLETLGASPIAAPLRAIEAMRSKRDIPALIAGFNQIGIAAPYSVNINQDARDPKHYIPIIYQGGLGLPDRDYYLRDDDAKLKDARGKYVAHVEKMLTLAGIAHAGAAARQVLELETQLARAQWTRVENRDPVKTYNKVPLDRLDRLTPGYAWKPWLSEARLAGRTRAVIVAQPSYLAGFAKTVEAMPLAGWKAYFEYHVISAYAPYLSRPFVEENFAFAGGVLSGTPVDLPRWKRGVETVDAAMGQGLGKLYVAKYFPPASKARMDAMVKNILAAYKQSIAGLDWMGAATKKEAQVKLARFDPKIGYPSKWRDYSVLVIQRDDLVGNITRARGFEYNRNNAKLGRPIDRTEWGMTPQTVNAYYNGLKNEIVFPAAILQPPFFDPNAKDAADDATNYGAIGAVIGHEISHGFDDRGSQFDGDGNLRNWWTVEDRNRFNTKTKALIAQYDAFEPVPGYHLNGALTLGENIADNSGIAIAYKAYHLSLRGKPAPVIDGLSGDARFYRGFATQWRSKLREPAMIMRIKSDPHSPGEFRTNGTLRNQAPFYSAFNVQPGDGMYLAPDKRVTIW